MFKEKPGGGDPVLQLEMINQDDLLMENSPEVLPGY